MEARGQQLATEKAGEKAEEIAREVADGTKKVYQAIEKGVAGGYKAIEKGVVSGYKAIKNGVVEGFDKITDKFVGTFLTKEGETVEQAKNNWRLKAQPGAFLRPGKRQAGLDLSCFFVFPAGFLHRLHECKGNWCEVREIVCDDPNIHLNWWRNSLTEQLVRSGVEYKFGENPRSIAFFYEIDHSFRLLDSKAMLQFDFLCAQFLNDCFIPGTAEDV